MGGFYRVLATRGQVRFEPHGAWETISITTPMIDSVCPYKPAAPVFGVRVDEELIEPVVIQPYKAPPSLLGWRGFSFLRAAIDALA